jgi:hypothetical protein
MPFISILRVNVEPGAITNYERGVRWLTGAAQASSGAPQWTARFSQSSEGQVYSFAIRAETYAELLAIEPIPDLARRLLGEGDGNAFLELVGSGIRSSSSSIIRPREDLSTAAQRSEPAPLSLVTRIRVSLEGQRAFEDLIRKINEAAIKLDEKRQVFVAQTAIGDMSQYAIVQAVDNPAELDQRKTPQELLSAAFGEEGEQALQAAAPHVQEVLSALSTYRPDLSNQS